MTNNYQNLGIANHRRGQISLAIFSILAILIVAGSAFYLINLNRGNSLKTVTEKTQSLSSEYSSLSAKTMEYYDACAQDSIIKANVEFGIDNRVKNQYEYHVASRTQRCMEQYFAFLEEQGYNITVGPMNVRSEFMEDILRSTIDYPFEIQRGQLRLSVPERVYDTPRARMVEMDKAIDTDMIMFSTDMRARLDVAAGTIAYDHSGNELDEIGVKLTDKKFSGLNNPLVLGNTVYQALPSGATFSEPIELTIEFRPEDIPSNRNNGHVAIAWWDEGYKVWRQLPTTIGENKATAKVNHFTIFAVLTGCQGESNVYQTPILYNQYYEPTTSLRWMESTKESGDDGKTIIPLEYKSAKVAYQELDGETIIFGGGPFAETESMKCQMPFESGGGEAEQRQYCCCLGDDCAKITGIQNCQIYHNGASYESLDLKDAKEVDSILDDWDKKHPETKDPLYPKELISHSKYEVCRGLGGGEDAAELVVGYPGQQCIGGTILDGDGDDSIYFIALKNDGGACVNSEKDFSVQYIASLNTVCEAEVEIVPPDQHYNFSRINVKSLTVTKTEISPSPYDDELSSVDTEAWCRLQFTRHSGGWTVNESYETCGMVGSFEIAKIDGEDVCAACSYNDNMGILTYDYNLAASKGDEGCTCSTNQLGTAYCDTMKKCDLVDGKPMLIDWTDPAETSLCDKCTVWNKDSTPGCGILVFPKSTTNGPYFGEVDNT